MTFNCEHQDTHSSDDAIGANHNAVLKHHCHNLKVRVHRGTLQPLFPSDGAAEIIDQIGRAMTVHDIRLHHASKFPVWRDYLRESSIETSRYPFRVDLRHLVATAFFRAHHAAPEGIGAVARPIMERPCP
jgi:hypothetical protein